MTSPLEEAVREWALEKAATHHRLAHENEHLRREHIASSSAYRSLADEAGTILNALSPDEQAERLERIEAIAIAPGRYGGPAFDEIAALARKCIVEIK